MAKRRANGECNIRKRKDGRWEEELAGARIQQMRRRNSGNKVDTNSVQQRHSL